VTDRRTDRRTDRQTDGMAIASTALAMRALRRAVKIGLGIWRSCGQVHFSAYRPITVYSVNRTLFADSRWSAWTSVARQSQREKRMMRYGEFSEEDCKDGDGAGNAVEENSSVFSLIRMR